MNRTENWDRPFSLLDSSIPRAAQTFLIEQTLGNLLHFIYRERAIHIHRGLVGLVAEEILNPVGTEPSGFQKTCNRVRVKFWWCSGIVLGRAVTASPSTGVEVSVPGRLDVFPHTTGEL